MEDPHGPQCSTVRAQVNRASVLRSEARLRGLVNQTDGGAEGTAPLRSRL
jgi:hypothetical protein